VVIGLLMAGGNLLLIWHLPEIVVIIGAALGAFTMSNSVKRVKRLSQGRSAYSNRCRIRARSMSSCSSLSSICSSNLTERASLLLKMIFLIRRKVRCAQSVPKHDHIIEFIPDCVRLMVGGNLRPNELEALLDYEL